MSRRNRKLTAWIAGAALLFSALSPAMAAVLFSGRADILVRILGLPEAHLAAAGERGSVCQDHAAAAHHDNAHDPRTVLADEPDDASGHAAHGIYCSLCLTASSMLTVAAASPSVLGAIASVAEIAPRHCTLPPRTQPPSNQHSRAPPVLN